jgi:hypothetical protein
MWAQSNTGKAAVAGNPEPAADRLEARRQFWEARIGRQLTLEDAREIVENLHGFFRLLAQWDATTPGA